MMTSTNCCLTTKDFAVLEVMLERRRAFADPIVHILEQKLSSADVVPNGSVGPDIVTLNSRVVFSIDAGHAETRTLVRNEVRGPVGSSLSVATRREAAGRAVRQKDRADGRRPHGLTLVYSAAADWRPLGETAGMRQTEEDDPGPSAA